MAASTEQRGECESLPCIAAEMRAYAEAGQFADPQVIALWARLIEEAVRLVNEAEECLAACGHVGLGYYMSRDDAERLRYLIEPALAER